MNKAVSEIQAKMKTWTDAGIELAYNSGYEQGCQDRDEQIRDAECDFYQRGLDDAWECARKLCQSEKYGGLEEHCAEIFNKRDTFFDVFDFTASEAIAKVKEYEGGVTRQSIIKSQLEDIITGFTEPVTCQEIIDAFVQIGEKANE